MRLERLLKTLVQGRSRSGRVALIVEADPADDAVGRLEADVDPLDVQRASQQQASNREHHAAERYLCDDETALRASPWRNRRCGRHQNCLNVRVETLPCRQRGEDE